MRGRLILVGTVHEAVPALGALLGSGMEIAEVVTPPAERGQYSWPSIRSAAGA